MKRRYPLRLYLAGALAARAGDEMSGPALLLAGFTAAGSPGDASSLLAGITASAAVGGPVLGVLLDRAARPGRPLAVALMLYAAGLGAVLATLGRLPFAVTVLIAVCTGLLGPALSGGWTAQLPRVVAGDRLPRANALDAMTFGVAGLVGPALAGGAAELLGGPPAVVIAAGLIGVALPAAWLLPAAPGRADRPTPGPGPRSGRVVRLPPVCGEIAAGARAIVQRPLLARATLSSVVCCVAQGMLTACTAPIGEHALGGAGRGAMLLFLAAVSALAANAVLVRFPRRAEPATIIRAGALVQAAALALAASLRPGPLIVAALLLGVGEGPLLTALFAVRHREAPNRLRGQIFTTGASLKITGFALGAWAAGPLAARSLPGTLLLAASVSALGALATTRGGHGAPGSTEPDPGGRP
ncbi:MFS transporter [Streptomyces sp. NPDC056347]|uniref:MFS transporter n=1 Tax=Streptomyces sp. NPDC056347 TaxID=3345790 RepID=UPI0035D66945